MCVQYGGCEKGVPGVAGYLLTRDDTVVWAGALMCQGVLGDPTACPPATTSAFPGLFSKGLGLPTDTGA